MNTDFVAAVGESVHARPFMLEFCVSFRNINNTTTSGLCFLFIFVAPTGANVYRTLSCGIYFVTAASPRLLNLFSPAFSSYCVMTMLSMWLSLSSSVRYVFK